MGRPVAATRAAAAVAALLLLPAAACTLTGRPRPLRTDFNTHTFTPSETYTETETPSPTVPATHTDSPTTTLTATPSPSHTPCVSVGRRFLVGDTAGGAHVVNSCDGAVLTFVSGLWADGLAWPPGGAYAFATRASLDLLLRLSPVTGSSVSLGMGSGPYDVSANPAGSRAAVSNRLSDEVTVVDVSSWTVVATIAVADPRQTGFSNDGSYLFAPSSSTATLTVLDLSTDSIVAVVPVGTGPVAAIPYGPLDVFVLNATSNDVTWANSSSWGVAGTFPVSAAPYDADVSPNGSWLYVAADAIERFSLASGTSGGALTFSDARELEVHPSGSWLYARSQNPGRLCVVDTAAWAVVATLYSGGTTGDLAISADGSFLGMAGTGSGFLVFTTNPPAPHTTVAMPGGGTVVAAGP